MSDQAPGFAPWGSHGRGVGDRSPGGATPGWACSCRSIAFHPSPQAIAGWKTDSVSAWANRSLSFKGVDRVRRRRHLLGLADRLEHLSCGTDLVGAKVSCGPLQGMGLSLQCPRRRRGHWRRGSPAADGGNLPGTARLPRPARPHRRPGEPAAVPRSNTAATASPAGGVSTATAGRATPSRTRKSSAAWIGLET